jgi:hypothetical protein
MRHILFISCAIVSVVACAGQRQQAGTTTITSAPVNTNREDPAVHRKAMKLSTSSEAIANGVCEHESHCGRANSDCLDATVKQARQELLRWNCEPAAVRARLEECLVGFQSESCDVRLNADRLPLCPPNEMCSDHEAKLIDPGPALAKIWEEE